MYKVAILIAMYNDEVRCLPCVQSCLAQTGDCQVTVVVVDDGSTDRTGVLLQTIQHERLILVTTPHNERVYARNVALQRALEGNPDYILFIDADMLLPPTLIDSCVAFAHQHNAGAVVIPELAYSTSTNYWSRVKVFERNILNNSGVDYDPKRSIEGARFWQTNALLQAGGFAGAYIGQEDVQPTHIYAAQNGTIMRITAVQIRHDEKYVTLNALLHKKSYYFGEVSQVANSGLSSLIPLIQRWYFFRPVLYRRENLVHYAHHLDLALGMLLMYILLTLTAGYAFLKRQFHHSSK